MIQLSSSDPFLSRFVTDLEEQHPRPRLGGRVDLSGVSEEERLAALRVWGVRVADEYRSVVVFSELLGMLARIEAPFACLAAVQRLIGDELRHTQLCAEALLQLDTEDKVRIDLAEMGLPPSDDPLPARVLEIVVRELVVAENESVAMIRAYRDATEEPVLKNVLEILLQDEVRHAAAGRHLAGMLRDVLPAGALGDLRARLPRTVERDLAYLRRAYTSSAADGPGRRIGASVRPSDLHFPKSYAGIEACWGG